MKSYQTPVKVDALPEPFSPTHGNRYHYYNMFCSLVGDNSWYEIATYKTRMGANASLRAFRGGERILPEGEWEYQLVNVWDDSKLDKHGNPDPGVVVKLFVRWLSGDLDAGKRPPPQDHGNGHGHKPPVAVPTSTTPEATTSTTSATPAPPDMSSLPEVPDPMADQPDPELVP